MGTTTKISFEDFQKLQETSDAATRYELDEGELIVTPSSTAWHNLVGLRLWRTLAAFVEKHHLGMAITEAEFRLSTNTVRRPDVALIAKEQLGHADLHCTPLEGAPLLAVEIISPSNLAEDMKKKVSQYLAAGTQAVWLIYPALRIIEIHDHNGIRGLTEQDSLEETNLFPGLALSVSIPALFDENPEH